MNALIADDDPLVGLTLRHFLEKADKGASCTHVTDGAAALRALAGGGFDVVFLDLELPELDGRNVLQALPPELPVIVVAAHTDFAALSYDFGVVDYLVKPLEFSRFHRAWQKLLACRRSPREITATVAPPPTVRSWQPPASRSSCGHVGHRPDQTTSGHAGAGGTRPGTESERAVGG